MRYLVWGACLLACGLAHAGSADVTIELPSRALVRTPQVRLGQVAYLTTKDAALLRRLMDLSIGAAPRAGAPATLTREQLGAWLRQEIGLDATRISWKGSAASEVQAATMEVSGNEILSKAAEQLRSWLAHRSERSELTPVSMPRDFEVSMGDISLRARPVDDSQPRRRMLVWVEVWSKDRFVRAVPVAFDVEAWGTVAVAAAAATAGSSLEMARPERREVDLARSQPSALRALPAGMGDLRLRRSVVPGESLTARHLEPAPAVVRGAWAAVRSTNGGLTVESRVLALEDGQIGQTIRVRQEGSSAMLARVISQGQVEIHP